VGSEVLSDSVSTFSQVLPQDSSELLLFVDLQLAISI